MSSKTSNQNNHLETTNNHTLKDEQNDINNDTSNRIKSLLWKEAKLKPISTFITKEEQDSSNIQNPTPKRSSYLAWKPYFLAIAKLTSQRSKDPSRQIGACIVDSENRILGIGYNGFPRGCSDDVLPWSSCYDDGDTNNENSLHHKKWFMVHAEVNAILNKIGNINNTTMYVYGSFPNNECAKIIIQAGIKEIVYIDNGNNDNNNNDNSNKNSDNIENMSQNGKDENELTTRASRILFGLAGVKITKYNDFESSTERIPNLRFPTGADPITSRSTKVKDNIENTVANDGDNKCIVCADTIQHIEDATPLLESCRHLLIREANYDPDIYKRNNPDSKYQHHLKRLDYLSWDDYFMSVASLSAYRSKDPNTQVGACIVDSNKCIIGIGYNGFPRGCSDDYLPWSRRASNPLHTKYMYVVHAEVNAILNKGSKDCTGATIYVDLFPCNDCAKVIIQSGIKEVVYLSDTYHNSDLCRASRIMFDMAGVKCRQYFPTRGSIHVDIFDRD